MLDILKKLCVVAPRDQLLNLSNSFARPFVRPSFRPFYLPSARCGDRQPVRPTVRPTARPFARSSARPYVRPSISCNEPRLGLLQVRLCPSFSICPSVRPSFHLTIRPPARSPRRSKGSKYDLKMLILSGPRKDIFRKSLVPLFF